MSVIGPRRWLWARPENTLDEDRGLPLYLFFASIWLVYLFEPIGFAWRERETVRGVIGLVATVLFAVTYLWHFASSRRYAWGDLPDAMSEASGLPYRRLRYGLLAVLSLVSTISLGQQGTVTWVFLAVAGLWTFPLWVAMTAAGVLAGGYEVLAYRLPGWDRDSGVSLSIILAMLAVAGGMIASRRARDLGSARRENARLMVQEERNRMARDLHDILGHSLTVITVKAELASRLIDVAPERAKAEVDALERLAREALADVRGAVEGFREISLSGELARAREALLSAGIDGHLPRAVDEVPADLRELFAWAVREGVTNVIRHSGAHTCTVTIEGTRLRIVDDGTGATSDGDRERVGGNGLRGLRERAAAVGATVTTRSSSQGFEVDVIAEDVTIRLPSTPTIGSPTREAVTGLPAPTRAVST